ncbi:MAG: protein kinase [Chitinivibrionales bacterium]|nr:protein kinase [Chitinivibrionales bacterium]
MAGNLEIKPENFIGRDLGTVTLLKLIGKGASGGVFLGFQRTLKRQVAVKIMPKSDKTTEASRELFRQEAEMVAVLSHPNIIPIFEMGEADDCYYQVIQVIKGQDLDSMIKNRLKNPIPTKRTIPLDDSIPLFMQALDGLAYAHAEGVVHQDIKPANILIEERTKRPLIADFGIARTRQSEVKQEGVIVGSPLFMAPEQVERKDTDQRADIYSMGIVLFQTIAGKLPLADKNPMELLIKKIEAPEKVFTQKPSEVSQTINHHLENIILKAIAPSPDDRYQSCEEFREDVESYKRAFL